MTTIVHKRGTGIPAADDLTVGEIAIDTSTGTVYTKNNRGEVVPVGGDEVWSVSEPDEYGVRVAKFSDQVNNSDDDFDFLIRYHTDGSKSRATVNAQYLFGDKIQSNSLIANEAVEAPEVKAQALEGIATVTGTLVVGDPVERDGEAEVKAPDGTAIAVGPKFAGMPPQFSWGCTVSMDGTIQAKDYLDADGNSIIGGDVDLDGYVKLEANTQFMKGSANAFEWNDGSYMVRVGQASTTGFGMYESPIYVETENGIYALNNYSFLITGGKIQGRNGSTIVGFDSVQATDFLDADGNSIIGGGGDVDLSDYVTTSAEKAPSDQAFNGPQQRLRWGGYGTEGNYYVTIGQGLAGGIETVLPRCSFRREIVVGSFR